MPQKLHAEAKALVDSLDRYIRQSILTAHRTVDPGPLDEMRRDLTVRLSRIYEQIDAVGQQQRRRT